jgi:nucleotide-binding universal stress UspA family protein
VTDPTYVREHDEGLNVHSDEILATFSQLAKSTGVAYKSVAIRGATPQEGIIEFAIAEGCDVIVMGSHGRSRAPSMGPQSTLERVSSPFKY